jgi:hypothetical protein
VVEELLDELVEEVLEVVLPLLLQAAANVNATAMSRVTDNLLLLKLCSSDDSVLRRGLKLR